MSNDFSDLCLRQSDVDQYVVGCDIGGANIKVADNRGRAIAINFPMWLKWAELGSSLATLVQSFPLNDATHFAITMTGELADCFETRREGVQQILRQVEKVFAPERTAVYAVGDRWLSPAEACQQPWEVAASNWFALATWIGACTHSQLHLVLDIGSTTVDIIPMKPDSAGKLRVATRARTDRDRLQLGQLVYTGLERTPIAAILNAVTVHGERCPVMAERFATSDDCYVLLGFTPEFPDDSDSADNRPRTKSCAHARLARMVGEDVETLSIEAAIEIADQCIDAQAAQVAQAIERNLRALETENRSACQVTVVGHGRALAERALGRLTDRPLAVTWLADQLSPDIARCAPAVAVAELRAACFQRAVNNLRFP